MEATRYGNGGNHENKLKLRNDDLGVSDCVQTSPGHNFREETDMAWIYIYIYIKQKHFGYYKL